MYEIREDPTTGDWVVISTERAKRPISVAPSVNEGSQQFEKDCPFCPGNEHRTPPEVFAFRPNGESNDPSWELRIVPNKYPAVILDAPEDLSEHCSFNRIAGRGRHEVFIETPRHNQFFGEYSDKRITTLFEAIQSRVMALRALNGVKHVVVFKNAGRNAGISLLHPHGQIIALPLIPPAMLRRMDRINQHHENNGGCLVCEMIQNEIDKGARVIANERRVLVLSPFAPKTPFETWVLPIDHVPLFEEIQGQTMISMATGLRDAVKAIANSLGKLDFNLNFIDGSLSFDPAGRFHFFMKIVPRITAVAGFEFGTDMFMNTHAPEQTAKILRNNYPGKIKKWSPRPDLNR